MGKRGLVLFRRDLRIIDNTALNAALQQCKEVSTCFVFNPVQIADHPYKSNNGLAFLIESLEDLAKELESSGGKLQIGKGPIVEVLHEVFQQGAISDLFINKDYTPFSRERDKEIAALCESCGVQFHSFSDALLVEPSKFGKPDGTPYTVYTPFAKRAAQHEIRRPTTMPFTSLSSRLLPPLGCNPREFWPTSQSPNRRSHGGRAAALSILEGIQSYSAYREQRDFPALDATTILSPHNKFGTVSIREVYWKVADHFNPSHTLIRELFWRDFFTHIAWHFPHVFQGTFHKRLNDIQWSSDPELFDKWCQGATGFPIVDAGMRELVATGYMHNRVRMIVASFLTKDLLVDWRQGEAFFAKYLTEYDPAVNNGSWQWAASTGCDAQPYFRIFNPWLQQQKFDGGCDYIKKWVPELRNVSSKAVHELYLDESPRPSSYSAPCVDHARQKILATALFKDK